MSIFFASWGASNNGLDDRCNVRVSAQTRCQSTDMNIHYTNIANLVRYSIFICVEEDPKFHENHDFLNFAPTLFRSVLNTLECNINQYRYMLPYRTKSRVKTTQSCGSEFWVKWLHYGTIGSHSFVLKNNLIHPTLVKRKLFIVIFLLRGYPPAI